MKQTQALKLLIAALICLATSVTSHARGSMSLNGRVRSISTTNIELTDGRKFYSLKRSKLMPFDRPKLSGLKVGSSVHFQVPYDAFSAIK